MLNNKPAIVTMARAYAHAAHDFIDQKRKYTRLPYWVHTDEVAGIVAGVLPNDYEAQAAAHMHDVLEDVESFDTTVDLFNRRVIGEIFGERVQGMVVDLTDVFTKEAYPIYNRKERKRMERERLGNVCPVSQTIKLADLISNTSDIAANDPNFARLYIAEKQALLPMLIAGDARLWTRAADLAIEVTRQLDAK